MPLCGACPFVGYCVVFLNTVNVLTQKNTTERARGGGGCSLTGEGESPGAGLRVRSPARSNYSSPTSGLAHAS